MWGRRGWVQPRRRRENLGASAGRTALCLTVPLLSAEAGLGPFREEKASARRAVVHGSTLRRPWPARASHLLRAASQLPGIVHRPAQRPADLWAREKEGGGVCSFLRMMSTLRALGLQAGQGCRGGPAWGPTSATIWGMRASGYRLYDITAVMTPAWASRVASGA